MSLINREALLAEYDRVHVGEPGKARKLMEDAPTVEPERKRGKWINISDGIFEIVKCDQCGRTMDSRDNFCPRCGSDMTEDSE